MVNELKEIPETDLSWIEQHNAGALAKSQYNLTEAEKITSVMLNIPS